jgi:hypothetical protein
MGNGRDIVITAYGHDRKIDKIAVSAFDSALNHYGDSDDSNARTYCDTINNLELNGKSWVFAKIVPENAPFSPDAFVPLKFDIIDLFKNPVGSLPTKGWLTSPAKCSAFCHF